MGKTQSFRHAVKWAYVTQISEQGLNALFTFVFAILLGPRDFGIAAMGMAYILFVKMFLEQGLVPALVQRKDLKPEHLNSVFCFNLALGVGLTLLSISLSRWWASLNHVVLLGPIISFLSLTIPLEALTIVQRAILQRDMNFKSFSIRSVVSIVAGGAIGLGMAFRGYGVWSLVGKQISTDFVGLIALWRLSDWRPHFQFSFRFVKELIAFSASSFIGNLGLFMNNQSDVLLIGLFFGPVAVGIYRLAGKIAGTVVSVATSSLQAASFPQFCRLQDKPEELRNSVLSCLHTAAIVTIPVLAGIFGISKLLMAAIGPKWTDGSDALRILCVVAIAQPILYFLGPLLQALSKPHYLAVFEWIHAAIGAGSLALAGYFLKQTSVHTQVSGIAATRFVTVVVLLSPTVVWALRSFAGVTLSSVIAVMAPSLAAGGTALLAISIISLFNICSGLKVWPRLFLDAAVAGIVASATIVWLDNRLRQTLVSLLASSRSRNLAPAALE